MFQKNRLCKSFNNSIVSIQTTMNVFSFNKYIHFKKCNHARDDKMPNLIYS